MFGVVYFNLAVKGVFDVGQCLVGAFVDAATFLTAHPARSFLDSGGEEAFAATVFDVFGAFHGRVGG
jgi:hypothetical protein